MAAEFAAKFNVANAWAFYRANQGNDYGYGNLLWGWQDNEQNYMYPLTPEVHAMLPAWAGKLLPAVADLLWLRAFNIRVGTVGLDTADVYDAAFNQKGWDFRKLHWQEVCHRFISFNFHSMLVFSLDFPPLHLHPPGQERDDFLYTMKNNNGTTVSARSMVCNVFVCSMWQAAGMFADQPAFSCGETTNWDIETLKIFDTTSPRPAACVAADPDLPYCQIAGNFRVRLPFYNSRWPIPSDAFNNWCVDFVSLCFFLSRPWHSTSRGLVVWSLPSSPLSFRCAFFVLLLCCTISPSCSPRGSPPLYDKPYPC